MTKLLSTTKNNTRKLTLFAQVLLIMLLLIPMNSVAQTLIAPTDDSTFFKETRNDDEFAVLAKNGTVVSLGNKYLRDSYGKFYQLSIIIQNLTPGAYAFDPDSVKAYVFDDNDKMLEDMKIYTSEGFQNKIRSKHAWNEVLNWITLGLNSERSRYQTALANTSGYGSCSYLQPVKACNSCAASLAKLGPTDRLVKLANKMECDKKVRAEGYLTMNTIGAGEGIYGYMNVKRLKGDVMTVIIPVNGTKYVFKWDISKKKRL